MKWLRWCYHSAILGLPVLPLGLCQSICAELATGLGFERARLQAAGRVFQQTRAPLGLQRGHRTGNGFLCRSAKTAAVCFFCVCEHTDRSSVYKCISWWQWVCPRLQFRVKKAPAVESESSALGCIILIYHFLCIKEGTQGTSRVINNKCYCVTASVGQRAAY